MDFMDAYNSKLTESRARREVNNPKRTAVQPPRAPRALLEYRLPATPVYRRALWF